MDRHDSVNYDVLFLQYQSDYVCNRLKKLVYDIGFLNQTKQVLVHVQRVMCLLTADLMFLIYFSSYVKFVRVQYFVLPKEYPPPPPELETMSYCGHTTSI